MRVPDPETVLRRAMIDFDTSDHLVAVQSALDKTKRDMEAACAMGPGGSQQWRRARNYRYALEEALLIAQRGHARGRRAGEVYLTANRLPEDRAWVCAHRVGTNWIDDTTCTPGAHYWKVVNFKRGITKEERDLMPPSERKNSWRSEDEGFNNERGYCWDELFGPGTFFGQDVDMWFYLPNGAPNVPS